MQPLFPNVFRAAFPFLADKRLDVNHFIEFQCIFSQTSTKTNDADGLRRLEML